MKIIVIRAFLIDFVNAQTSWPLTEIAFHMIDDKHRILCIARRTFMSVRGSFGVSVSKEN